MPTRIITALLLCAIAAPAAAFDLDFNKILKAVQNVKQAATEVAEPQEIELGEGIASNLLGAAPLLQDAQVQHYVNQVGRWLAMQTERPDLPWRFGVLNDDDINAFAAPGGLVFITKGLLARMQSEAELAGVLAHEISHVLRKHHLQAIKKGARTELMAEFTEHAMQKNGADPVLHKLVSAGTEVYVRGLDKADEFEADRMGVVIHVVRLLMSRAIRGCYLRSELNCTARDSRHANETAPGDYPGADEFAFNAVDLHSRRMSG